MSKVISITEVPVVNNGVYGIETRSFCADGIITITRRNPGFKKCEPTKFLQIQDDKSLKETECKIIDSISKEPLVSKFWKLEDGKELHEYISPDKLSGIYEIRDKNYYKS